jgi:hypothetical protein
MQDDGLERSSVECSLFFNSWYFSLKTIKSAFLCIWKTANLWKPIYSDLHSRVHKFFKSLEATSRFWAQKDTWRNFPYWGPTFLEWLADLIFMDFVLGECELIHMFVHEEKNCSNYAENIRHHSGKLSRPDLWTLALAGCVILQFTTRIERQVAIHVWM